MFQSLYQPLLRSIKIKTFFVFLIIHVGVLSATYGLASLPSTLDAKTLNLLVVGVVCLYGGVLLATFFILWPVYSFVKTIRKLLNWKEWLLHDLPQLIAIIPPLIQTLRSAFSSQDMEPTVRARSTKQRSRKAKKRRSPNSRIPAAA